MSMESGKKSRLPKGDDGRTIANMNVDGMPWYSPTADHGSIPKETADTPGKERKEKPFPLSKRESFFYTWGALKAALLVTAVICGGIVLFILFCVYVWFR